jgi:hypothetical protein
MTDRTQFEAMLNALINEDQEAAKEIFHNIVVAKSREIYEELLAEDFDTGNPYAKEEEEEEGEEEEGEEADDEEGEEADDEEGEESPFGGEEEGDGEEGEGDIEDRVMDLEDALEDLKAEFEHLLAGEEHEEETGVAGDHGGELDAMAGGDIGSEEDQFERMMEYTIKVPKPTHGDNGVNTRSPMAGKNDMGGTVANIARGGEAKGEGTSGGLLKPTTTRLDGGNVNVPGGTAGKTAFKKKEPGHGAEKKSTGDNGDKSAGSPISGLKSRAK